MGNGQGVPEGLLDGIDLDGGDAGLLGEAARRAAAEAQEELGLPPGQAGFAQLLGGLNGRGEGGFAEFLARQAAEAAGGGGGGGRHGG
eukprot:SAG22_NODE_5440_length_1013_cov_1.687090_1_plen_87_part_10